MTEPQELRFPPSGGIPNNPVLPVVLMRQAVLGSAADICARMERNGWTGTWVWSVFDYHHYHPDAHEALVVASGEATLLLGGPDGEEVTLRAGDAVILPAGTGHKRLSQSEDFRICGAYPPGQSDYTTLRAEAQAPDAPDQIAAVALPATDPVHGSEGPLLRLWSAG